jgi:hypothetical protein
MDPEAEVLAADIVATASSGIAPANVAEDSIHALLSTCGVTLLAACMTIINVEGLDLISAFIQLNGDSDVTEMTKRMAAGLSATGRVILDMMQVKWLQALLVYWVKDHDKRGLVAQPDLWDNEAMIEAMECKEAEHNFGNRCWSYRPRQVPDRPRLGQLANCICQQVERNLGRSWRPH